MDDMSDAEMVVLSGCISNARLGQSLLFASCSLFLFDYVLTVSEEVEFLWWPKRLTLSSIAFMIARYFAMTSTIITLLPHVSLRVDGINTILRLVAIVASEFIVAVRTWAIWGRDKRILWTLVTLSVSAVIPAAVIVAFSVKTNHVEAVISPAWIDVCSVVIGDVKNGYVVPYVLTIIYEIATLSFSLIRITKWRKTIPKSVRAPLIDTLWQDGVMYFSFMLVLGFMNIGLVTQSEANQLRKGGAHLQAVLHSMLSTRLVLHLADPHNPRDITAAGCSVYYTNAEIEFTSQISISDDSARLPMRRSRGEDNEHG
ncbi:hypothetical protein E1B28_013396 [Marasmius oreades]|uniref:DUF6533 domain-containing protein n=1 Tax=Marasmius oreades TaxID=181124 RepID=A0A9P7RQH5_9AGAR|nr:uncharacterized protein E1B28_013396 [Marasmius oreades]KAG7087430.1 hypothetical protein E1B28_013396 [Marasmius oreades]